MVHIMRHLSSLFLLLFCLNAHAVTAKSYLVTDTQGQVVIEKDADQPRPIASITKPVSYTHLTLPTNREV